MYNIIKKRYACAETRYLARCITVKLDDIYTEMRFYSEIVYFALSACAVGSPQFVYVHVRERALVTFFLSAEQKVLYCSTRNETLHRRHFCSKLSVCSFFPATFSSLVIILISSGSVVSLYICHVMLVKKEKKKQRFIFLMRLITVPKGTLKSVDSGRMDESISMSL